MNRRWVLLLLVLAILVASGPPAAGENAWTEAEYAAWRQELISQAVGFDYSQAPSGGCNPGVVGVGQQVPFSFAPGALEGAFVVPVFVEKVVTDESQKLKLAQKSVPAGESRSLSWPKPPNRPSKPSPKNIEAIAKAAGMEWRDEFLTAADLNATSGVPKDWWYWYLTNHSPFPQRVPNSGFEEMGMLGDEYGPVDWGWDGWPFWAPPEGWEHMCEGNQCLWSGGYDNFWDMAWNWLDASLPPQGLAYLKADVGFKGSPGAILRITLFNGDLEPVASIVFLTDGEIHLGEISWKIDANRLCNGDTYCDVAVVITGEGPSADQSFWVDNVRLEFPPGEQRLWRGTDSNGSFKLNEKHDLSGDSIRNVATGADYWQTNVENFVWPSIEGKIYQGWRVEDRQDAWWLPPLPTNLNYKMYLPLVGKNFGSGKVPIWNVDDIQMTGWADPLSIQVHVEPVYVQIDATTPLAWGDTNPETVCSADAMWVSPFGIAWGILAWNAWTRLWNFDIYGQFSNLLCIGAHVPMHCYCTLREIFMCPDGSIEVGTTCSQRPFLLAVDDWDYGPELMPKLAAAQAAAREWQEQGGEVVEMIMFTELVLFGIATAGPVGALISQFPAIGNMMTTLVQSAPDANWKFTTSGPIPTSIEGGMCIKIDSP